MYNRYIPQPDGSYRRRQVADPSRPSPASAAKRNSPAPAPVPSESTCNDPHSHTTPMEIRSGNQPHPNPRYQRKPVLNSIAGVKESTVSDFFKKLLPKDFDTGDLLIILLLLLMSGDSKEDQNSALLTLAIYMFL